MDCTIAVVHPYLTLSAPIAVVVEEKAIRQAAAAVELVAVARRIHQLRCSSLNSVFDGRRNAMQQFPTRHQPSPRHPLRETKVDD